MVFCRDFSVVRFVSSLFPSFISHLVMLSLEEAVDVAPGPFDVLELAVAHSVAGCAGTPGRGKGRIWPWACALCCCSPRPCHWGASPPWARRGGHLQGTFSGEVGWYGAPRSPGLFVGRREEGRASGSSPSGVLSQVRPRDGGARAACFAAVRLVTSAVCWASRISLDVQGNWHFPGHHHWLCGLLPSGDTKPLSSHLSQEVPRWPEPASVWLPGD